MSAITALPTHVKTAAEVRTGAVSLDGKLEPGESLTGAPTCAVTPASGAPTVSNIAVTAVEKRINGEDIAAGRAITFLVTGGTAGATYNLLFSCGTNSTPAQTVQVLCKLRVVAG